MPSGVTRGSAEIGGAPCQKYAIAAPPTTTSAPAARATATSGTPRLRTIRGGGGAGTSAIGRGRRQDRRQRPVDAARERLATPQRRALRRRGRVPSPGRSGAIPGIATPSIVLLRCELAGRAPRACAGAPPCVECRLPEGAMPTIVAAERARRARVEEGACGGRRGVRGRRGRRARAPRPRSRASSS